MNIEQACFYLYHTSACHLCEEAEEIVNAIVAQSGVSYQKVDIAEDDNLLEIYGIRIPVLMHIASQSELGWPFDYQQAKQFMEQSY